MRDGKVKFWLVMSAVLLCAVVMSCREVRAAQQDVVRITVAEGGNQVSHGSGALVGTNAEGQGVILTCWHLFRDAGTASPTVAVRFPSQEVRPATLLHAHESDDLALLLIDNPPSEGTPVAASEAPKGAPLILAGYGGEGRYLAQNAVVVQFASFDQGATWNVRSLNAQARSGDSGGPIFDSEGYVCGVISAARDGSTVGTCGERVYQYVQSYCPGGTCLAPRRGVQIHGGMGIQFGRRQPIAQPQPRPQPQPVPVQPVPGAQERIEWKQELMALRAEIAKIRSCDCETKPQQPAEQPKQPEAPKPEQPQQQADCKPCECGDLKAKVTGLRAEVDALRSAAGKPCTDNRPLTVQIINPDGTVASEDKVTLGGTLKLKLVPIKKPVGK